MHVLRVRNVHAALPEAISLLHHYGKQQETRNGTALVCSHPVTTMYMQPEERVLFWPERDANPFFHFYEGLWMLGGRNDVASLTRFVKRMSEFSDNGTTFHGAYGHRWRKHFGLDQLQMIISHFRNDPLCRRQVLQMWDPRCDLVLPGKDIPCNLEAHFLVRDSQLDMLVSNRSNDIIWGTYGANAVHFSMLQEFVAAAVGNQEVCALLLEKGANMDAADNEGKTPLMNAVYNKNLLSFYWNS